MSAVELKTIQIPEGTHRRLKILAAETDSNVATLAHDFIRAGLDEADRGHAEFLKASKRTAKKAGAK
jgi:predicted transcriptional regulator